jgi:hypothetical protein
MSEEKKKSRSFRDLDVWKLSLDFAKDLYQLTNKFPSEEQYGLTSQIRRAAVSIPSNIAEGQKFSQRVQAISVYRSGFSWGIGDSINHCQ